VGTADVRHFGTFHREKNDRISQRDGELQMGEFTYLLALVIEF
tara:strand:- start:158 stop:286 length:129 start_codon:yes stop_codon:yes gene_type:complete